jgi:hypothetical protein
MNSVFSHVLNTKLQFSTPAASKLEESKCLRPKDYSAFEAMKKTMQLTKQRE